MPTTYEKCDPSVDAVGAAVIAKYYPDLAKAGVTVSYLFARDADSDAPLKINGYACAATVRATNLKERAKFIPDAEIVIDELQWANLYPAERFALLDHELYHLELKMGDHGIETDDLGRPKLKLKLHDAQVGIFRAIIQRHGMHALDAQIARDFIGEFQPLVNAAEGEPDEPEFNDSNPDFKKDE